MKKIRVLIWAFMIVVVAFVIVWILRNQRLLMKMKQDPDYKVDSIVRNEEGESVLAGDGDVGLTEMDLRSPVEGTEPVKTRTALVKLVLEYNGYVPFKTNGRVWGEIPKLNHGVDNRKKGMEDSYGVDSLGYVLWIYYQMFQEIIPNPAEEYRNGNRISATDLLPGDIGMEVFLEGEPNHYGIFLGYDGGIPVFAHCTNVPCPGYPQGVSRLSSIALYSDKYYMGTSPATFQYFMRPDVTWYTEGKEMFNEIDSILSGNHTGEIDIANACGEFGSFVFELIKRQDFDTLTGLLNLDIMSKKGWALEQERFNTKIKNLSEAFADKKIMLYNIAPLNDTGAVARFYIASDDNSADERRWDTLHCLWMDITCYIEIEDGGYRFLPFHESSSVMASEFGFTKE